MADAPAAVSRLVADTHALIWYLYADDQLSDLAVAAIKIDIAQDRPLIVPAAVFLDVRFKLDRGSDDLDWQQVWDDLVAAVRRPQFDLRPIDDDIIDHMDRVPRDHVSDPVDRLVIATALQVGGIVVTADADIRNSGGIPIIF